MGGCRQHTINGNVSMFLSSQAIADKNFTIISCSASFVDIAVTVFDIKMWQNNKKSTKFPMMLILQR